MGMIYNYEDEVNKEGECGGERKILWKAPPAVHLCCNPAPAGNPGLKMHLMKKKQA